MTKIVDLDQLVPEDIEFAYRGEAYIVPGDIDIDSVFRLVRLFGDLNTDASEEQQMAAVTNTCDELLKLLQVRQPELEELPFGLVGMRAVLQTVIERLGLIISTDDGKPASSARKPTPKKKPSVSSRRRN